MKINVFKEYIEEIKQKLNTKNSTISTEIYEYVKNNFHFDNLLAEMVYSQDKNKPVNYLTDGIIKECQGIVKHIPDWVNSGLLSTNDYDGLKKAYEVLEKASKNQDEPIDIIYNSNLQMMQLVVLELEQLYNKSNIKSEVLTSFFEEFKQVFDLSNSTMYICQEKFNYNGYDFVSLENVKEIKNKINSLFDTFEDLKEAFAQYNALDNEADKTTLKRKYCICPENELFFKELLSKGDSLKIVKEILFDDSQGKCYKIDDINEFRKAANFLIKKTSLEKTFQKKSDIEMKDIVSNFIESNTLFQDVMFKGYKPTFDEYGQIFNSFFNSLKDVVNSSLLSLVLDIDFEIAEIQNVSTFGQCNSMNSLEPKITINSKAIKSLMSNMQPESILVTFISAIMHESWHAMENAFREISNKEVNFSPLEKTCLGVKLNSNDLKTLSLISPTISNIIKKLNKNEISLLSENLNYLVYYTEGEEVRARTFAQKGMESFFLELIEIFKDDSEKVATLNIHKKALPAYTSTETVPTFNGSPIDNIQNDIFRDIDFEKMETVAKILQLYKFSGLRNSGFSINLYKNMILNTPEEKLEEIYQEALRNCDNFIFSTNYELEYSLIEVDLLQKLNPKAFNSNDVLEFFTKNSEIYSKEESEIEKNIILNACDYISKNITEETKEFLKDYIYESKDIKTASLLVRDRNMFTLEELYMLLLTLSKDKKSEEYNLLLNNVYVMLYLSGKYKDSFGGKVFDFVKKELKTDFENETEGITLE